MRVSRGITQDAEFEELGRRGHTGNLNDRQYSLLGNLGLSGALPDRINSSSISAYALRAVSDKLPPLVLDFQDDDFYTNNVVGSFSETIDHSATSNATMTDSSGYIKWRPHNLLKYSEEFDNAYWTKSGFSVSGNSTDAPDGTTTADTATTESTAGSVQRSVTLTTDSYTLSWYVKNINATWVRLGYIDSATNAAWFNISAGTAHTVNGAGNTSNITDVGNGWYRLDLTIDSASSSSQIAFVSISNNDAGTAMTSGESIYIWGAHIYRSDLGGMADVPADARVIPSATKYVRTAGRVSGPELVTNGTFDTDTSGWTSDNGGALSVVSQQLRLEDTVGTYGYAEQTYPTKVDSVYQVSVFYGGGTATSAYLQLGSSTNKSLYGNLNLGTSVKAHVFTFVATTTLSQITLASGTTVGSYGLWDNISVKEIDVDPSQVRYLPRRNHHVYNGSQWVNEGLLHESEARTNLLLSSMDTDTTNWSLSNATTTLNATSSPDGLGNGVKLIDNAIDTSHYIQSDIVTIASGAITGSAYLKAAELTFARLRLEGTSGLIRAWFDLSNGVVSGADTGSVATIEDVGAGWYRCSLTETGNIASGAVGRLQVFTQTSGAFQTNYVGDGASGVYVWGAQLEAASTPSSYIPTSGASATRAAETLTIPAANLPWPEPVVIGGELVTNGTFDTGTTGWTGNNANATLTFQSGGTAFFENTADFAYVKSVLPLSLDAGKVYKVSFDLTDVSRTSAAFHIGVGSSGNDIGSDGSYEYIYYSDGTDLDFQIRPNSAGLNTLTIDNISVKEVNPLALSIQMDGRMTYADTGNVGEVYFFQWRPSNDDYIEARLETDVGAGEAIFVQRENAVSDAVNSDSSIYSPDILVPFNISSRHGSTFVNGAVDGVALTEDTTPVALPDLENTDLELGYDFMGTIGTFRIWAEDIGDTGIAEATEPSEEATLFLSFDGYDNTSYIDFDWSE